MIQVAFLVAASLVAWLIIYSLGCRAWDRYWQRRPLRRDIAAWERLAEHDRREALRGPA